jgi:predicted AAA+ superfamily ATPase
VSEVSQLSLLAALLPEKVGSLLSINNLRQDLGVAFDTAERWVTIFDNLYYSFRVQAFGFRQIRAARKEKKLYLWDWSAVEDPGARFENLVASHLLKYCHFRNDAEGDRLELRFLRDAEKREIDFVVIRKNTPLFGVECKSGEGSLSPNIRYFAQRLPIPKFYQVHLGEKHVEIADARTEIAPFHRFAHELGV